MSFVLVTIGVSGALLILLVVFVNIGYRIGKKRHENMPGVTDVGLGDVDAAVFGLLGLILAFTFGGAASRLDVRRAQIVEEANAIGTAYLRIDLLPASEQPAIRKLFRQYLDSRIHAYDLINTANSYTAARAELDKAGGLQQEIWSRSVAACQSDPKTSSCMLVLPALNEMIDITTTRTMAIFTHSPALIIVLLAVLSSLAALLAGYSMSQQSSRSNLHTLIFALAISMTIYTVLDLEFPRFGLVTLRSMDRSIVQLRDMIK